MDYEIKYAKSGHLNIAYQIIGDCKETLIVTSGWVSNIEEGWNLPGLPEWLIALSSFCKLIIFDKRGIGLSDRVDEKDLPALSQRIFPRHSGKSLVKTRMPSEKTKLLPCFFNASDFK